MKICFLLILFTYCPINISAQKIQGVYCGEIITKKNWLVIDVKDKSVNGALYVTQSQRLSFAGSYDNHVLRGVIQLTDNKQITIEGERTKNSLIIHFTDSAEKKSQILYGLPTGTTEDDIVSETNDPDLLGKWETLRELDSNGNDITSGKQMFEFRPQGSGLKRSTNMPAIPAYRRADASRSPSAVDLNKSRAFTWETKDGRLTQTEKIQVLDHDMVSVFEYTVGNDTLILKTRNNKLLYWVRK